MALIATDEKKTTTTTTTTPATTTTTQEVTSPTTKVSSPVKPATQTTPVVSASNSAYNKTMEALKEAENGVPSFNSDYDSTIAELYSKIVNREPFSYNAASDPMYGQYKESYTQMGKQAMRDTMGQAAALTGGYGNSYGQAVGQQQYNAYLQRLNDVLPELYGMAYDRYNDEGNVLNTQLSLANAMRDTEYGQFRDAVGDDQYNKAWDLQQAEALAQYGNFSGFEDLYGKDEADQMRLTWAAANPDAAWTAGLITELEYYKLTGATPRTAIPVAPAATGGGYSGGSGGWSSGGSSSGSGGTSYNRIADAVKDLHAMRNAGTITSAEYRKEIADYYT